VLTRAYENRLAMPADMPVHMIARPHVGRTPPSTKVLALPAPATSSAAQGATPAAPHLRRGRRESASIVQKKFARTLGGVSHEGSLLAGIGVTGA
jgi:hypothetical protein